MLLSPAIRLNGAVMPVLSASLSNKSVVVVALAGESTQPPVVGLTNFTV